MRVLLAHNFYRSSAPSGENDVFKNEKKMLEDNGIEVIEYTKHSDSIANVGFSGLLRTAYQMPWSKSTYHELSQIIKETRPDIVHFHNTFPLITASAYAACKDASIPVVQTLHNYRFICPGALLQRGTEPCELCIEGSRSLFPAFKYRCYRESRFATSALIRTINKNRKRNTYAELVDCYITLTEFAASRFKKGGLPSDKITVKNNFLPDSATIGKGDGGYAVYVGRLGPEKGIRTLVQAWEHIDNNKKLLILGDGPIREELEQAIHKNNLNIELAGFRSKEEVLNIVADAAVQIIPSECYEGFPMVVLEALASGTPIIASDIGSLSEIIENGAYGYKFTAGNTESLASEVNNIFNLFENNKNEYLKLRQRARKEFDDKYTAKKNFIELMGIYKKTVESYKR